MARNRSERMSKNFYELFKRETRKLIIILTFLKSLRLYSKERLTLKAEFIKNKRQFTFPLYPDDLIVLYWKYLIWISMLIGTLFYPLYPADDDFDGIIYAVDIIFAFDIIITFNLGYVDDNFNLNISYIKIARSYIKGWLILDIITIMPYKFIIEYKFIGFIKLLKIIKYLFYHPYKHYNGQQSKAIVQTIQPDNSFHLSEGILFLLTVLLKALLLIHISGCFYHYIEENDYISSFYWATQAITMVGYGDEKQNNTLTSIWIIVGLAFIAINIGDFAKLLSRSNLHNDQEIHQVDQLAQDSNLPEILQMEVSSFVQTNLHMNQFWSIDHKQMINQLPQQLQKYLIISSMLTTCRIVPMFLHDMNSTAELLKYSRFFVAEKDKILYREGQSSKEVFYLIKGDVRIVSKNKFPLLNIIEGSLFGELEAIAESPRTCYAMTYAKSLLLILPFKQLKQAMRKSQTLNFEVRQLYARRQQLLQQNQKNEKVQQRKLKRQNVRFFTASQINMSPSDLKTQRQEKQLQNMYSYNNQLLKRIIGFKKHKLEQFLIKFKRSVNKIIDLNRQLEITPPEDWHELNDFQLIKQVIPTKILKLKNVNYSKIGSSLYSQSEHKIHQIMTNYRNYRQVEIQLKRILLLHQRKCKERMDNVTLKGVVTRFQQDPQFLNDQKITVLRGRIFSKQVQREEITTIDFDQQDIQKIMHQIDKINKFWIAGSMKQFELYQSLHQYQF